MRFLAIVLSYLASAFAATGSALLLLIGKSVVEGKIGTLGEALRDVLDIVFPALVIVTASAAIPFACCIVLLHFLRQKSMLAHGVAGAVVSLAAFLVFTGGAVHLSILLEGWYIPVAGTLGGLAYWLCRYRFFRHMTAEYL